MIVNVIQTITVEIKYIPYIDPSKNTLQGYDD
jgi:hypothetical protein